MQIVLIRFAGDYTVNSKLAAINGTNLPVHGILLLESRQNYFPKKKTLGF